MSNIIDADKKALDYFGIQNFLDKKTKKTKVLSLDCFDTLLWRTVTEPKEVFKDLQNHPLYIQHGITAETRILAERNARQLHWGLHKTCEITIDEIYENIFKISNASSNSELIDELIRIEIEAEKEFLFAYTPMFDLLQKAKKIGLKTILVSDMYIHATQLKELVEFCAQKAGVKVCIDEYFTSADHRTTKGRDLFNLVAGKLGVDAESILHLGDNPHADFEGARRSGVLGYHFDRFTPALEECMRKNSTMQRLLSDGHVDSQPMISSWHGTWSKLPKTKNIFEIIGWYYLGPILINYCRWLSQEIHAIKNRGDQPRVIFLMRDGYLPFKAFQFFKEQGLIPAGVPIHTMDVSKFASIALDFKDEESIKIFLINHKEKLYRIELVRQLFGIHNIDNLPIKYDVSESMLWDDFYGQIIKPESINSILENSNKLKNNFKKYLKSRINFKKDETIIFADLGYEGTIQDHFHDVITKDFSLKLEGRYFILKGSWSCQGSKKGMIDYKNINKNTLSLLLTQIQILEQLMSNDNGSLINFDDNGKPVYEANLLSDQQKIFKGHIQTSACDFVQTQAKSYIEFSKIQKCSLDETLGLLGRLTLQPNQSEIELYQLFCHDINNGSTRKRMLSNPQLSKEMLIRGGGITYDSDYHKMLATDLNTFSPELRYFNYIKKRYGISLTLMDHKVIDGHIPCVLSFGEDYQQKNMACFHSHEGFKVGILSSIENLSAIGFSLGQKYEWIQVHSISLVGWSQFASDPGWAPTSDLIPHSHVEGGQNMGHGIIHFDDSNGYLHTDLTNQAIQIHDGTILVLVFRDIGLRSDVVKGDAGLEHTNAQPG